VYQLSVNDYILIAKRRWLHFTVPLMLLLVISAVIALLIPPVYQSSGVILVESQKIPSEIIQSTVTGYVNERIQMIKQRIMTRDNLLKLVEKHELFKENQQELTVSEMVSVIRGNIEITPERNDFGGRKNRNVIAFSLSFQNKSPSLAQAVANDLVTLFLEENVRTRTQRATETTEFLTDEVLKLKEKLEKTEEKIAIFKEENSEALPENLNLNTSILQRTEEQLKDLERSIEQAQQGIRILEIDLTAAKQNALNINDPNAPLSPKQELENLELEYTRLSAEFTDKHPDVRTVIRKIQTLKAEISKNGTTLNNSVLSDGLDVAKIQSNIDALNKQISSYTAESKELEKKRNALEEIILRTPHVKNALLALTRDYDNTLAKYKDMQSKEMEASLAESLEEEKKAERFTLIEAPLRPEKPIKPNRAQIMAIGIFLSVMISAAFVFLLELTNKRVWGADALTSITKQRPLVSIPYILTVEELNRKKKLVRNVILLAVVAVVVALFAIHFLYLPLDILVYKIMARLG